MKKAISLLLVLVMCLSLCACGGGNDVQQDTKNPVTGNDVTTSGVWSKQVSTDEFGDVYENSVSFIAGISQGTFSNSATNGSDLTVVTSFMKKPGYDHYIALFDLLEYNDHSANFSKYDTITFKMKLGDEIIAVNMDMTSTLTGNTADQTVALGVPEYTWAGDLLYNALYNNEDVRCIITSGSSEYTFTLESDNFNTICSEVGFGLGAAELTAKEAVKIFLDDNGFGISYACNWFNNNLTKFEQMDTEQIKAFMEGYFLGISLTGHEAVAVNDEYYWYADWSVYNYSASTGDAKVMAVYIFDSDYKDLYAEEKEENSSIVGYAGWRTYHSSGSTTSNWTASADNNLFRITEKDGNFTDYQCRRITEDLILLYTTKTDGSFDYAKLMLKCNGYAETDIKDAISYALNTVLNEIEK